MKLDSIHLFQLASARMQWLSARQKVISENIANADTPGYRARDVTGFGQYVDRLETSGGASAAAGGDAGFGADAPVATADAPDTWGATLSGNTVVLEQQTVKAGETASQYRLAASLYRKASDLLTLAATGKT
jgi:flagellar basal-body rod protein FlgB